MNDSLPVGTYRVAQLCEELRLALRSVFPEVWVAGEVQRVREHRNGHLYCELVEKGAGDQVTGKLDMVLFQRDHRRVRSALAAEGQRIAEGLEIRCHGRLDFYPPFGRVQFVADQVDPLFTLGLLERRRRETLAALTAAGLLDRNRSLEIPRVPLRVALITSSGSAAYHDFVCSLEESGYGFEVTVLVAAVQGRDAEREVARALERLESLDVDCAALIRGGGARTDLAAFDSRRVAEAIARAAVPVVTGLGHETDETIADRVAHSALKTPTGAAQFLVERVSDAEDELNRVRQALARLARKPLERSVAAVGRAERGFRLATVKLQVSSGRLDAVMNAVGRAARARVNNASTAVEGLTRLCRQLAPERVLERGFSITRDDSGRLLRRPQDVAPGARITTELADGGLTSRVEETG